MASSERLPGGASERLPGGRQTPRRESSAGIRNLISDWEQKASVSLVAIFMSFKTCAGNVAQTDFTSTSCKQVLQFSRRAYISVAILRRFKM